MSSMAFKAFSNSNDAVDKSIFGLIPVTLETQVLLIRAEHKCLSERVRKIMTHAAIPFKHRRMDIPALIHLSMTVDADIKGLYKKKPAIF